MPKKLTRFAALLVTGLLIGSAGCAQRKLTVTSDPPGALVTLNGQEAGRTPFTTDFTWYGFYEVEVRKDGYETLITRQRLIAPLWNWVPFDFIAELAPWGATDRQAMSFALTPRSDTPTAAADLVSRGLDMRTQANAGLPATQPAQ